MVFLVVIHGIDLNRFLRNAGMLVLPLKLKPIVSLQEFRYLVKGFCYSSFALVWIFSDGNQKLASILSEAGKRQRQHKQCDRRVVKAIRFRVAFLMQLNEPVHNNRSIDQFV